MPVIYISTHIDDGLLRLVSQYQGSENVKALLRALVSRIQAQEDALKGMREGRFLHDGSAVGAQLDAIGQTVGLARNGLSDDVYRVLIFGQIGKNVSDATLTTIIMLTKAIFQTDAVYCTTPNAPGHARAAAYAEISLAVGSPKTDLSLLPLLLRIIQAAMPAGVTLVSLSTFDAKNALAPDGPQPWVQAPGDVTLLGGGLLADVIYQVPFA